MFLVGTFELTIDAKNRLSIPQQMRARIEYSTYGSGFYVVPGRVKGTLAIYPDRYYEQKCARQVDTERLSDEAYAWLQFERSQSVQVDPDSQGRILIPERLLKRAGIDREVTLTGSDDHMELWDRQAFAGFEQDFWPEYPARRATARKEIDALATAGGATSGEAGA